MLAAGGTGHVGCLGRDQEEDVVCGAMSNSIRSCHEIQGTHTEHQITIKSKTQRELTPAQAQHGRVLTLRLGADQES